MMNVSKSQIKLRLIGLLIPLLMTGCQPVISNSMTSIDESVIPSSEPAPEIETVYPSTPEEVIRNFLIAYPTDQIYAIQYLSPSFVKDLDSDSVARLLPDEGQIMGYIIESGSTSAEAQRSEILTKVAFQNSSFGLLFRLEIVDGRWAISTIEQQ